MRSNNYEMKRREFHGNRNYLNFYNQHVREFFSTADDAQYTKSILTSDGKIHYSRSADFNKCKGSLWTSQEKAILFKSLGRHSIHRVDLIQQEVKSKSIAEIHAYYLALKKQLKVLKKLQLRKTKIIRHGRRRKVYYDQPYPHLLSYKDMPISYEMSPYFLHFEEVQLTFIITKESLLINDVNRRINSKLKPRFNEDEDLIIEPKIFTDYQDLYKFFGMNYLRFTASLSFKALILLDTLARYKLKDMMADLIRLNDRRNVITKDIVVKCLNYTSNSRDNYLHVTGGFAALGIEQRDIFGSTSQTYKGAEHFPVFYQKKPNHAADSITGLEQLPFFEVKKVPKSYLTKLFEEELQQVDHSDIIKSQNHEHVLLTYLATANQNEINHTIFTDEEVAELGPIHSSIEDMQVVELPRPSSNLNLKLLDYFLRTYATYD